MNNSFILSSYKKNIFYEFFIWQTRKDFLDVFMSSFRALYLLSNFVAKKISILEFAFLLNWPKVFFLCIICNIFLFSSLFLLFRRYLTNYTLSGLFWVFLLATLCELLLWWHRIRNGLGFRSKVLKKRLC